MSSNDYTCETERIAAYVDGELDASVRLALEEHLTHCDHCASELTAQRLLMCQLDSAFASPFELAVPTDFAQVVAVRAESDMRGVRDRAEHAKALKFCLILGMTAFALLGFTSSNIVFVNAQTFADKTLAVIGLFGSTIYDAATGLTVASRVFIRGLIANSRLSGLVGLVLVALIIGLLTFLISRYHRRRVVD